VFTNREEAAHQLASKLLLTPAIRQAEPSDLLVLSIPRGGVIVGQAAAQALRCDHNVIIVKKIGFPGAEELAVGAIAEDGLMILDRAMLAWNRLTPHDIKPQIDQARAKVGRYIHLFRQGKPLNVCDKIVILVDDGVATGESMKAAIKWIRSKPAEEAARRLIVAVPVGSPSTVSQLARLVDEVICLLKPASFQAVGQFYRHFEQVSDSEVLDILTAAEQDEETRPIVPP
jgi:predicted phosphoribosyltransferase